MAIIGIDLGTTNSLACVWKDGKYHLIPNAFGEVLTPSAVSVHEDGTILVGKAARERLISHPHATAASFKRYMGTDRQFRLQKKTFTAPELSSFVLRKLRDDAEKWLGHEVTEAVISVPAYFNDSQRAATKQAGALAGIHVERLVNEPSAAALACRGEAESGDGCFLVFDFGGGTLDVSVVECFENIVEIIAVAGSNRLGGDDFDRIIADEFCRKNSLDFDSLSPDRQAMVLSAATRCKLALTAMPMSIMSIQFPGWSGDMHLTGQQLVKLSDDILAGIRKVVERALRDCGRPPEAIDKVIMVGGSCNMPLVQRYVQHLLKKPVAETSNPDLIVAAGVGIYAGIKARQGEIRDLLLTDICPFSLGTAIINHIAHDKLLFSPIIQRNTTLPSSRANRYYTVHDKQRQINIDIYQGEGLYAADNILLDTLEVKVPPAPAGQEAVDVRFTYDINGLLDVEVTVVSTGKKAEKLLLGKDCRLSPQELESKRSQLARLKIGPQEAEEDLFLEARARRLYSELTGTLREVVMLRLQHFQRTLESGKRIASQKKRAEFAEFLDSIESGLFTFDHWDEEDT